MTAELHKILCVDDEPRVLEALKRHLREHFEVLTADSGAAAIDIINANKDLAIIVSDMRMPEMDGATLLRHARVLQPGAVRVLLTGQADIAAVWAAFERWPTSCYSSVPWSWDALCA
jgi:DNA-binding NtrC family response regulator